MGRKGRNHDGYKHHQIYNTEQEGKRSQGWESRARGPGSQSTEHPACWGRGTTEEEAAAVTAVTTLQVTAKPRIGVYPGH